MSYGFKKTKQRGLSDISTALDHSETICTTYFIVQKQFIVNEY